MTSVTKLDQFFNDELRSDIRNVLITRDPNGKLTLFGQYSIIPTKDGYYKVRGKNVSVEFTTVKNALAYVTLTHSGKYIAANRVHQLDLSLCSINTDLAVHRNILKSRTDAESRLIFIIKVQEDTIKRRRIVEEIKSYINSSIQIQASKFNHLQKPNFR